MSSKPTMRFLNEADMRALGADDVAGCVDVSDEVFRLLGKGDYLMGGANGANHGMGLSFPATSPHRNMPLAGPDRRVVAMPAYLGGRFNVTGLKWYGSNAANPESGLPRSILTVMLNDKDTGAPLALMAANTLSATRTGAVPGVAARYLIPEPPQTLAVIGCGTINRSAVRALLSQLPTLTHVTCVNRSRDKAETFARWLRNSYDVTVTVADDVEKCVAGADVVTVAASRTAPLKVESSWFADTAVILLSGPMEADDDLWTDSRVIFDSIPLHQAYMEDASRTPNPDAAYSSMMGGPLYRLIDAGRLPALAHSTDLPSVMEDRSKRTAAGRTIFIACGMAVLDVAWAFELLKRAKIENRGSDLDFWGDVDPIEGREA